MTKCHKCGNDSFDIATLKCLYCDDINRPTNDAGEAIQSVTDTLKQRGSRYGEFNSHSKISQALKAAFADGVLLSGKSDSAVPDYIWESVSMICHKLARVANGDPMYDDNFIDIAGYAQLVVDELNKENKDGK